MPKNKNRKQLTIIAILITGLLFTVGSLLIIIVMTPPAKMKSANQQDIAIAVQNDNIDRDFILTDSSNNIVASKDFRGKLLLIYFGFTHCPDICPASLIEMVSVIDEVEKTSEALKVMFLTVDPKRDTPEALNDYFKNFDPRIIALTGSTQQVTDIAKKFKVYYEVANNDKQNTDNYLINHSSFYYLIGKDGKLIKYYTPGASGKEIAQDIMKYHLN